MTDGIPLIPPGLLSARRDPSQDYLVITWIPPAMGLGWYHAKILASFLPCDNILENPMQSSVRNHDAFSNNKTWKEIQICHAKFVFLRITNMFNVNAVSQHHDWNHDPCRIPMNKLKLSVTEKQGICVENIQSASNFIIFSFVG